MMECRFRDGVVNNNGRPMSLRRGQLLGANSWLASRWNWTPKTVRWWLEKLSDEAMISFGNDETMRGPDNVAGESKQGRSKGRLANVITICNFDVFQMLPRSERQVEGPVNGRLTAGLGQVNGDIYKEEQRNNETKKQEKDYSTPETPPVYPRAGGPDEIPDLPGLNGATSLIVRTLAGWLSPHSPDIETARKTVAEAIKIYGDVAVRDGFAEYTAEIVDGRVRVPSVKSLYGFFRQAKGRPERSATASGESTVDRWKRLLDENKKRSEK
jgi:hypothetical protein